MEVGDRVEEDCREREGTSEKSAVCSQQVGSIEDTTKRGVDDQEESRRPESQVATPDRYDEGSHQLTQKQ